MKRKLYTDLLDWKAQKQRKPLILKGTRQVGKTYLLKEFGKTEFQKYHHFDFAKDKKIAKAFEGDLDPVEIIKRIEIQREIKINPLEELVIFDEIQECPNAVTSLKYFCEDMPQCFVIGSGSFLGVSLSEQSYPVGKIKTLTLFPMTFFEFLEGLGKDDLVKMLQEGTEKRTIHSLVHEKAFDDLKYYLITGGLPEVVQTFKNNIDEPMIAFLKVRELQREIIDNYQSDMAKHAGKLNAVKIQTVFNNVPVQLARENKTTHKFVFKDVLSTRSNFEQLEDPILWLEKAGLIHKVFICKKAEQPLKAYTEHNKFKLFLFDTGLLGTMVGLEPKEIYHYDYGSYKGYFAENFVVQELRTSIPEELFAWQEGISEIEILLSISGNIVPVEIKAGVKTKAKSLSSFETRYQPKRSFIVSANPLSLQQTGLSFLPLYLVGLFEKIVEE